MSTSRPQSLPAPIGPGALSRRAVIFATALPMLAISTIAARADGDPSADDPAPVALFDGRSLDGWEATDFYRPGVVAVAQGAIVLAASDAPGGMTGITTTRRDLPTTDYELTYQARRLTGRDFFAAATFPVGDSFLTLVNGGWGGNITGLSSIDGMDASENLTGTFFEYAEGTWYTFRIRVTGSAVRCWIDDDEVVTLPLTGQHLGTRLETRASQPLGFATWGETAGALRAIAIRPLAPAEIAANAADPGA